MWSRPIAAFVDRLIAGRNFLGVEQGEARLHSQPVRQPVMNVRLPSETCRRKGQTKDGPYQSDVPSVTLQSQWQGLGVLVAGSVAEIRDVLGTTRG
jgi:hypothetical protein